MSVRNGCVCEREPCICPYRIEVQRVQGVVDGLDWLVGVRWRSTVRHPTIYSSIGNSFHAYTAKRAERKARKWINQLENIDRSFRVVEVPRKGRS